MKFAAFSLLTILAFAPFARADETPQVRIAQFDGDRAAAISYTFDDNLRDQYTLAVPMLNEVGFKGTFFVIPGATPETLEEAEKNAAKKRAWGGISWPELKAMAAQNHEIASHTWSHPNLTKLTPAAVDAQLSRAYDAIQTQIGAPPLTLAFPFNADTPKIQAAALKYHVAFRDYQTSISGVTTVDSLSKWADKLVEDKKWGVIMAHGIGNGYAALSDPEILRAHFKEIKSREKEIWVDTFANVARYQKERDDAKLTVTGKPKNVTCVLSGTLGSQIYDVLLTLVLQAKGAATARATRAGRELATHVENGAVLVQVAPAPETITVTWK